MKTTKRILSGLLVLVMVLSLLPVSVFATDEAADVTINIANLTNGTVTTDKESYKVGDTVTLTVTPKDANYFQKLYINGEPLMLNWKTEVKPDGAPRYWTYSFVADKESYDITGSFVTQLQMFTGNAETDNAWVRWDNANQAHGVVSTYYPNDTDSWWLNIKGEYSSVSVIAKNYLPLEDTIDGNGKVGYHHALRMIMSNGTRYAFRLFNDGKYAVSCFAASGSVTGWGSWTALSEEAAAALNGEGVKFTLERTAADTFTISVNGQKMFDYKADGLTADIKVASVGIQAGGNSGEYVDIPFEVKKPSVQVKLPAELANGTVIADKESYVVGDTVTLNVNPADGYTQKLYINGEPLMLDYNTGKYSFVATEQVYEVTGGFVAKDKWFWTADWELLNQGHGIAHAPAHSGKDATGELVPAKGLYNQVDVLVKDASHGEQKDYAMVLKMHFEGGLKAEVRLLDRDDNGKYCLQAMGDSFSGWNTLYWLSEAENAAVKAGDGVWYGMSRVGTELKLLINGNAVKSIDLAAKGITADTAIDQIKIQSYNFGYAVDIPYEFKMIDTAKPVTINIPELTNGTVTTDKESYKVGDTVHLSVAPAEGYVAKLYINGEPILLDYVSRGYSFVANEEIYEITGEFVTRYSWYWYGEWDLFNQGHNVAYAPANNGKDATGELVPTLGVYDGIKVLFKDVSFGDQKDFAMVLKMHFVGGLKAEARLIDRDDNGKYCLQVFGNNLLGNWATFYWLTDAENAAVKNGDGVWYGMLRDGNELKVYINDKVVKTVDLPANGVTAETEIDQIKVQAYNFTYGMYVPYELLVAEVPHVHSWTESEAAVAATCEAAGKTAVMTCSSCGTTEGGEEIPALGHKMVETEPAVDATCEAAGKTAVLSCANNCGLTTGGDEIPALDHADEDNNGACDACGASLIPTDANLKFYYDYAQLQVGEDIMGYFIVNIKNFNYDEYYAEFKMGDQINRVPVGKTSGNYIYFYYTVYAFKMTEEISVTVYGVKDGVAYAGQSLTYTIRDSIVKKLDSWVKNFETNKNGINLLVNLLNYGTEAQKELNKENTNYPTDNLAPELLALIKTEAPEMGTAPTGDDAGKQATLYSMGMMLQERIKLTGMFKVTNASSTQNSDYLVVIEMVESSGEVRRYEFTGDDLSFSGTKTKYVTFKFDGIKCWEMRCDMRFTLYLNGEQISATIVRSADMMANNLMAKYPTLIPAIMNYSDWAQIYFNR